ncbi:xenotropic and polytropic retrovirus receptor 1-like [Myzus persicae]|uniref:xenotropic and polytropic retrovirus receptor 1-like n=1 Tax=Myzus persicae TaxID=13164 RepID=UPI000B931430|nr:xenotropic and polytropic retrovirus receptor 1-like [Myzus persicae]
MKFAEHLAAHITPEWRKQYISYEEMKEMLYAAIEQVPAPEQVDPDSLSRYYAKFDEKFFSFCDKELAKINTFYSEKLAEATRKFANLQSDLREAQDDKIKPKDSSGNLKPVKRKILRKNTTTRKTQELKLAFSEFYLSLILLQNYQNLNYTGFRKIMKKHDKLLGSEGGSGGRWRSEVVENAHFYCNKDIDRLISETEATVTQGLEGGDRQRAMKRLRVPPLGEQQSPWITFKVGLFSGAFVVMLLAVIITGIAHSNENTDWRVMVRLYRGPLLLVIFLFLMGINVYCWRSSGVNHVLIFELDPRNHLTEQHIMELATVFGLVWAGSALIFLYSEALHIPPYINPLILAVLMIAFLFNPTKTLRHDARFWVLRVAVRILFAPFFYVGFADFWLADQLTSLVPALLDFQYLVCFYLTNDKWMSNKTIDIDGSKCVERVWLLRPFVACLPAWFRFMQCLRRYRDSREAFPHLANAAKYATTFFVITFSFLNLQYAKDNPEEDPSVYFYLWISASIFSSLYSYIWDLKMDWGLFDRNAGENRFLREEIVYSSTAFYYIAIVEDFVLRFGWALSMSLTEMGYVHGDLMVSILSPLEVMRRFVWNFFRLENEHLNNCGRFRAVRDISVAPIDSSDQTHILRLMDEPLTPHDLNRNRRNKMTGGGGIGKKIPNLTFQPSRSVDEQASLILASLGTR